MYVDDLLIITPDLTSCERVRNLSSKGFGRMQVQSGAIKSDGLVFINIFNSAYFPRKALTSNSLFGRDSARCEQCSGVTFFHMSRANLIRSGIEERVPDLPIFRLRSAHRFSIGLRSGDVAGHSIPSTSLSRKNWRVIRAL